MTETSGHSTLVNDATECPSCGDRSVRTLYRDEQFPYGHGENAVMLKATVPILSCSACDLEFTDARAEKVRHEAVCRHLGVMTPGEIVSLRQKTGLSRAQFAEITKIGEASIARWERGNLIQSAAYDQLLYLLSFADNLYRLQSRRFRERMNKAGADERGSSALTIKLRSLQNTPQKTLEAESFQLRRTGT